MDAQNEHGRHEQGDPGQPHHDTPRSSRQPGRGQRPNQGRDQESRASGGPPRSGPNEGGGGSRGQRRGGSAGPQGEGREGRRRRKDGERRGLYGFGDSIQRCTCLSYHHEMPEAWPVHSRSNLATLRMIEVDRRPDAVLFCDGAHAGPHLWPDGEIAATSLPTIQNEPEPSSPSVAEPTEDTS
jgi:hypothetical protein